MKTKINLHSTGLQPLPHDKRDFSLHRTFGSVDSVPNYDFVIGEAKEIKQQFESDFCAAFSVTAASEYQEDTILSPEFQFALIKSLTGNPEEWGSDLRTACKSVVKFGSLPKYAAPYSLQNKDRDFLAHLENWIEPPGDQKLLLSGNYRKNSFFTVDGQKDTFDNFRRALWQNIAQKRAIITGCLWDSTWFGNKVISKSGDGAKTGHAFIVIGQKFIDGEPHLIAQLSSGKEVGDRGYFYFKRNVVNECFTFGAFMFKDLDPIHAAFLNKFKLSVKALWLAKAWTNIKNIFSKCL